MSVKSAQKERSRAAILESAAALLRERGISASSVADVMRGAGMTVGGFYGHFDSKESLFAETIRYAARTTWDRLVKGARGDSPRARVASVARRYLAREHRDEPASGCLVPAAAGEIARLGEPYQSALASEIERFTTILASALGDPRKDRKQALALIALMTGALSMARAVAGTPLSDEVLTAAKAMVDEALKDDSRA